MLNRRTILLILTLTAAGALLAWATARDLRSSTEQAERLMVWQARSVADLITESAGHGLVAWRNWEDEVFARLVDNARWIAARDSVRHLTDTELRVLAGDHGLGRINIIDAEGRRTATSWTRPSSIGGAWSPESRPGPRGVHAPVLKKGERVQRIGFREGRGVPGARYAVAVARAGGGAIVVNVFAESLRIAQDEISPGHLFRAMGEAHGIRYLVIQDTSGVLAASADSGAWSTAEDDPEVARLLSPAAQGDVTATPGRAEPLVTREIDTAFGRVFEVLCPAHLPSAGPAVLRVGLSPEPLDRAQAAFRRRALTRAGVFLLALGLGAGLLLAWQRHALLDREIARVRAKLEANEREARRRDKLVAMGSLASGVAHEIRNPLNTIQLTAQQMAREPAVGEELRAQARDIHAEGARIEAIVQQFLSFARPRPPRLERMDVGSVVAEVARTEEPAFAAAGVTLRLKSEPVDAELDAEYLRQILHNLVRNAREAFAGRTDDSGGSVALTVRRRRGDVEIRVEDDGPGIPAALRDRVFDLYFTTKPSGTGLGLALAAQAAASMGGTLRLDHERAQGTAFVLSFPRHPAPGADGKPVADAEPVADGASAATGAEQVAGRKGDRE